MKILNLQAVVAAPIKPLKRGLTVDNVIDEAKTPVKKK